MYDRGMSERPTHPTDSADDLERRTRELEILNAIAEGLNGSADLGASLRESLTRLGELLDLRTGWVWLLDQESGHPYLAAAQELPPGLRAPHVMEGGCECLGAFLRGKLDGPANILTCSRLRHLAEGTGGLRFHATVPLRARGKQLGVMNLASAEWRALSREELRLLHTVGEMVGVAVERALLFERSREAGRVEERNRLAREIHDTLAQGLSAIALHLETAEALLQKGADPEPVSRAVSAALSLSRSGLEEARRSVLDLRAEPLEGRTLAEALEHLARTSEGPGELRVRFEAAGASAPLPIRVEVGLFRVAQESVGNALRHADASNVTLELVVDPQRARLSVRDDGRGFSPEETTSGRFGLVGMRERTRLLGGTFKLYSTPGVGTCIHAEIPLQESDA